MSIQKIAVQWKKMYSYCSKKEAYSVAHFIFKNRAFLKEDEKKELGVIK
jgi:hypothetical protein